MTILDAMDDPALFGRWFGRDAATWHAWRVFLTALFGLPIAEADAPLYQQCTGRTTPQMSPAVEAWMIVGRRGGKSRIAALIALFLACFRDYREYLAPGEVGTLPILAADRKQARTVMRYMTGLINAVPMLKAMLASEPTRESIELTNSVVIEVQTASIAAVRNYTIVAAICDELAFWTTAEDGANPDAEIINALLPGMGTIPGSVLIGLSSPYARRGVLWENYQQHFGRDGADTLVWQADTATMHPHEPDSRLARLIAKAYEKDAAAASAEYGALFRTDVETFIGPDVVQRLVVPDRGDLPREAGVTYRAFCDPSGGSGQDSMTLAVAHEHGPCVVVDAIRESRPPFDPKDVVKDFAAVLKSYGCHAVTGDRYAGNWPASRFKDYSITYSVCEKVKSDLYRDLLPVLTSTQIELPDNPRLKGQLTGLERRTARGGKDSIDHAPRAHDDIANAVAGVAVMGRGPSGSGYTVGHLIM